MANPLFLGVDGGGTGSRAVLGDETRVLACAEGGPANPRALGAPAVWENLNELTARVLEEARLPVEMVSQLHVCMGLAGVGREEDRKRLLALGHPFAKLRLETDVHIALVGALGREEGVLLAAGTGSIAYGVDATGRRYRAGGWGLAVGDEGSGAWLGREAVRAALHVYDGRGEETVLLETVLARWGPAVDDLMERVRLAGATDYGSLAPLVFEAAAAGDLVAKTLREKAVTALVALLGAIDGRYPAGALRFSITGSVAGLLSLAVLERAPQRFQRGYEAAQAEPEIGALRLAKIP
ncbi:MAG: N-acetylglucosamine kinase [Deinococcota bacterium]|nr:N-acetylglucosamine kinase [Deinococcota bacterium]